MFKHTLLMLHFLFALLAFASPATADDIAAGEFKPFAEKHVVLQLSDQKNEAVVIDIANNLIKHYGGPDMIDIEIVSFGQGVRLMFEGGPQAARIASLVESGVRFYVCKNTLDTLERIEGKQHKLDPNAILVQAGVAHIIDRVGAGFTLVKP
jgi:intracellular sulfur oxidation DsrE/DsrF family protein